jgi:hypothetical protein
MVQTGSLIWAWSTAEGNPSLLSLVLDSTDWERALRENRDLLLLVSGLLALSLIVTLL